MSDDPMPFDTSAEVVWSGAKKRSVGDWGSFVKVATGGRCGEMIPAKW